MSKWRFLLISLLFAVGLSMFFLLRFSLFSPKTYQLDSHSASSKLVNSTSQKSDEKSLEEEPAATSEGQIDAELSLPAQSMTSKEHYEMDSESSRKQLLSVFQQVQRTPYTCAPTTVSMMLSMRGVSVSQEDLAKDMGTDSVFGTHNADAIRILNRYLFGYEKPQANQAGYRLATVTTSHVDADEIALFKERVKQNIKDGYPMYYTFDCARLYPNSKGEHNVIGIGYELTADGSDIAYLYYVDPAASQQDAQYGGLKKMTPEELFYAMQTCVEPNYAW